MNTFMTRSLFTIAIAAVLSLGGQWTQAANLPGWGGGTTTNQTQIQEPSKPLSTEPAAESAQTVQPTQPGTTQPGTWTAPATTSSPTVTSPLQPRSIQLKPGTTSAVPATGTRSTTQPSSPTGTAQQPVPGKKARFRITVNGFHVFAQQGVRPRRGHSYYVAAKVLKYSNWGAILSHETKVTKVMGHTEKFPGALKGGTATNNGGFRNGDTYPGSVPYQASGAYNDRLPLLVWEGILEEGGDIVVIEPTIWEKRDGTDIYTAWRERFPPQLTSLKACAPNEFNPGGSGFTIPPWTSRNPAPVDDLISSEPVLAGARVCVTIAPLETFRVLGRNQPDVIPGFTEKTFPTRSTAADPHGILLNYAKASMMAQEQQTEPVTLVRYRTTGFDKFPDDFVRRNQRESNVIPARGMQPFWFGSGADGGYGNYVFIDNDSASSYASFYSATVAHPIIPKSTALEMYLQIQQLPL